MSETTPASKILNNVIGGISATALALQGVAKLIPAYENLSGWKGVVLSLVGIGFTIYFNKNPYQLVRLSRPFVPQNDPVLLPQTFKVQPLEEDDTIRFHGRKTDTTECLAKIKESPFFCLDGESGCGKSSFLNVKLLLELKKTHTIYRHRIGDDVFQSFTKAESVDESIEALTRALDTFGPSGRLPALLCFDQFEEFFVTVRDELREAAFMELKRRISQKSLRLLFIMRSDFRDLFIDICTKFDLPYSAHDRLGGFSEIEGKDILRQMLRPEQEKLEAPVNADLQNLESLMLEDLLRPPSDPRLCSNDRKRILPIELNMVGMALERSGPSSATYLQKGRRVGLLTSYLEETASKIDTSVVLPLKTTFTFLPQFIAVKGGDEEGVSAITRQPCTLDAIQQTLEGNVEVQKHPHRVELALDHLCHENILTKTKGNAYELVHEYWITVLKDTQEYQKHILSLRQLDLYHTVYKERLKVVHSTRKERFHNYFAQDIPLKFLVKSRRIKGGDYLEMLQSSWSAFWRKTFATTGLMSMLGGLSYYWVNSDAYQIQQVIATAPHVILSSGEQAQGWAKWAKALADVGQFSEALEAAGKISDTEASIKAGAYAHLSSQSREPLPPHGRRRHAAFQSLFCSR